jgi:hypothetical protein
VVVVVLQGLAIQNVSQDFWHLTVQQHSVGLMLH